ncbi:MAG: lamin tail domain-containing protein [Flavobacterium sp. JAD_PAG50586_2]|nr:MAG: lamin tail domain-containing protein [Flavobacterium sp. JAD_PAG50586_2]
MYHYSTLGELNPDPFLHHMGEYIELYNYTTEDMPLKGWAITDYVSRYEFPQNAVIKAGEFIVVVYRGPGQPDYFNSFFPNNPGTANQIFYQDKIMLNNLREEVSLLMGYVRGVNCKNKVLQKVAWGLYNGGFNILLDNYWEQGSNNVSTFDFYVSSFHLLGENLYGINPADPLESSYVPETQDLEDIPQVQEALTDVLTDFTWDIYSETLLNTICNVSINDVEQLPSDTYSTTGKCFNYDSSGNNESAVDCAPPAPTIPTSSSEYTSEEMEDFSALIVLAPNPTSSTITATWSGTILGKITEMQVANTSGVSLSVLSIAPSDNSALINLTSRPTGIYIVKFILDSGQFISKNVIKL